MIGVGGFGVFPASGFLDAIAAGVGGFGVLAAFGFFDAIAGSVLPLPLVS
jgi:hypothetical protein